MQYYLVEIKLKHYFKSSEIDLKYLHIIEIIAKAFFPPKNTKRVVLFFNLI